ncbi:MAG: acetate--CoA ligase family protein [Promethearchaeota archaeon]
MDDFFNPESIAVLGASASRGKAGFNVVWNLRGASPERGLYPINPNRDEILGNVCYPDLASLPGRAHPVDLAVVCLPPALVEGAVTSCVEAGVRNLIVESGQFGVTEEEDSRAAARISEMLASEEEPPRVMGPNSIGVVDLNSKVNTSLIPFDSLPDLGGTGVAVVGQTGLIASGYLQRTFAEGTFPVSKVCCLGNKFDVDESDLLEYLAGDPTTSVIALYLEDVRDGARFLKAARACALKKPVVVLKSGKSPAGARAVSSHTGSIAGNDRVFEAAALSTGMTRVSNFEELWTHGQFFFRAPLPRGPRVAVISITGAGCVLSVDAAAAHGMEVPPIPHEARKELEEIVPDWFHFTNPLDLWSTIEQLGSPQAYARALEILLGAGYDAVVLVNLAMPESLFDWDHLARMREEFKDVPLFLALLGGHDDLTREWLHICGKIGIPVVRSPDEAIAILARGWRRARWLSGKAQPPDE